MAKTTKTTKKRVKKTESTDTETVLAVNSETSSNSKDIGSNTVQNSNESICVKTLSDVILKYSHCEEDRFDVYDATIGTIAAQVSTTTSSKRILDQTPVYIINNGVRNIIGLIKSFNNTNNFNAVLKSCLLGYFVTIGKIEISE